MSAEDHEHEDNYERAYESIDEAPAAEVIPTDHGFWRSLRELEGKAPPSDGNEFPAIPQVADPLNRRNFFHLMGASMGLAGVGALAAGCRYEKEEIVPLARRPDDQTPGQFQSYATAYELAGVGHALLATAIEGRPIKLDGNTEHPFASGAIVPSPTRPQSHAGCSTFAQAAILHLYDPDRSQNPLKNNSGSSIEAVKAMITELGKRGNVRVLSEATASPTVRAIQRELTGKGVMWHEYEPISWDNERAGTKLAFTRSMRPIAKLDRCETIVTIDCDLFVEHPASARYNRDFARSRRMSGTLGLNKMNRLWSVESTLSHTGAMADHRLALKSDFGLPFAMALDAALGGGSTAQADAKFLSEGKVKKFLAVLVEELKTNHGKAVVVAGRKQPKEVHALVARINEKIDAVGKTLDYIEDPDLDRPTHLESMVALAKDMQAGKVEALIILGGNPVFDAPVDLDFAGGLNKVKTTVHLSEYVNETSLKTGWHVPKAHFLEAWGDTLTWDGTVTIAQPLIAPLFGGLSSIQMLSLLAGREETAVDALVAKTNGDEGLLNQWRAHVHDGFIPNPRPAVPVTVGPLAEPTLSNNQKGSIDPENPVIEVTYHYSSFTYDGRFANNAWLQETPDFLTKIVWDNYAIVGPDTAKKLKIENDQMIKLKVGDKEIEVACYTLPGQARYSISLVVGGGRTAAGHVGGGDGAPRSIGWDVYKCRASAGFDIATASNVTAGSGYSLASTQEHWDIRTGLRPDANRDQLQALLPKPGGGPDANRDAIIKVVSQQEMLRDKSWTAEGEDEYWDDAVVTEPGKRRGLSLFREKEYTGHKWGMAIDLNTCTGCNACMVACQNENNVPVVGRTEVMNNREMHWIRIDRYFGGTPEEPLVYHQPLPCQQCENAPCEQVCPVGATSHSDEGLNDQAYNRCIGTRYCANNCPYKVRRFNFLDWNKEFRDARNKLRRLLFNPEVTVRMRGVMEKCTYCVQRIQNAKIHAKAVRRTEGRPEGIDAPLPDGDIVTACQAACPTEAIVFGDLSDPNSRVTRAHTDPRQYTLLPEVYTKPRTKYLAKVRNPNPKLVAVAAGSAPGGDEHAKGAH